MTKDEAIEAAVVFIGALPENTITFEAKLRELGYWIAPMEPTYKMLGDADSAIPRFEQENGFRLMGTDGARDAWDAMRDAFLSEEPK